MRVLFATPFRVAHTCSGVLEVFIFNRLDRCSKLLKPPVTELKCHRRDDELPGIVELVEIRD